MCRSEGEPAVNVYTEGGRFKPHRDKQNLTIIVPLSDKVAFTGGGTAFWSLTDCGSKISVVEDVVPVNEPTFVLTPPAGTALLWTGCVTHAGQPVVIGERCVLVASFSPKATDVSSLLFSQELDS